MYFNVLTYKHFCSTILHYVLSIVGAFEFLKVVFLCNVLQATGHELVLCKQQAKHSDVKDLKMQSCTCSEVAAN